jgi:hypothetical protein
MSPFSCSFAFNYLLSCRVYRSLRIRVLLLWASRVGSYFIWWNIPLVVYLFHTLLLSNLPFCTFVCLLSAILSSISFIYLFAFLFVILVWVLYSSAALFFFHRSAPLSFSDLGFYGILMTIRTHSFLCTFILFATSSQTPSLFDCRS